MANPRIRERECAVLAECFGCRPPENPSKAKQKYDPPESGRMGGKHPTNVKQKGNLELQVELNPTMSNPEAESFTVG